MLVYLDNQANHKGAPNENYARELLELHTLGVHGGYSQADVMELADNLQLDRFSVVGFSGGGPYALACASKIPHRLIACGIVAGVGHTGRLLSFLSMWLPWLILPIMRSFFQDEERAKKSLSQAARNWGDADRNALSFPGVSDLMAASLVDALKQGSRGAAYDGVLLGRPWGFNLEEIEFPSPYLWHGELDREVPVAMGRTIAEELAHCQATYYPDEGHISLIVNRAQDILKSLG